MPDDRRLRSVAFYLPQFHPDPRERRVVGARVHRVGQRRAGRPAVSGARSARPARRPRVLRPPAPRDPPGAGCARDAPRHRRASATSTTGFDGRRLLERPFAEVLPLGRARLPVLPVLGQRELDPRLGRQVRRDPDAQTYSPDDDLAHIRWLGEVFADPRYLRVDGKSALPRVPRVPHLPRSAANRRACGATEAQRLGIGELYLCSVQTGGRDQLLGPDDFGIDAMVQFAPFYGLVAPAGPQHPGRAWRTGTSPVEPLVTCSTSIYDYDEVVQDHLAVARCSPTRSFPCVSPGFDNSPRRPTKARPSSPWLHARALRAMVPRRVDRFGRRTRPEENLLFVNAWNEWAEGNHLEPAGGGSTTISRPTRDAPEPEPAARRPGDAEPAGGPAASARRRRALPAAVPPHPGERRVVGAGLHRVDQRRRGRGRSSAGHDQPKVPARARLLRPPPAGGREPRRPRSPARTASRPSATGTTGSPGGGCSSDRSGRCWRAASRASASASAGPTRHWTTIWTGGRSLSWSSRPIPAADDHERHFHELLPAFRDERYFRVDGRPLFHGVPARRPARRRTLRRPVAVARRARGAARPVPRRRGEERMAGGGGRLRRRGAPVPVRRPSRAARCRAGSGPGSTASCAGARRRIRTHPSRARRASRAAGPHPELPMVVSNWDSTPRFGRHGFVLTGSTPELFEEAMHQRDREHPGAAVRASA